MLEAISAAGKNLCYSKSGSQRIKARKNYFYWCLLNQRSLQITLLELAGDIKVMKEHSYGISKHFGFSHNSLAIQQIICVFFGKHSRFELPRSFMLHEVFADSFFLKYLVIQNSSFPHSWFSELKHSPFYHTLHWMASAICSLQNDANNEIHKFFLFYLQKKRQEHIE